MPAKIQRGATQVVNKLSSVTTTNITSAITAPIATTTMITSGDYSYVHVGAIKEYYAPSDAFISNLVRQVFAEQTDSKVAVRQGQAAEMLAASARR